MTGIEPQKTSASAAVLLGYIKRGPARQFGRSNSPGPVLKPALTPFDPETRMSCQLRQLRTAKGSWAGTFECDIPLSLMRAPESSGWPQLKNVVDVRQPIAGWQRPEIATFRQPGDNSNSAYRLNARYAEAVHNSPPGMDPG